jgi:hypothetical protein
VGVELAVGTGVLVGVAVGIGVAAWQAGRIIPSTIRPENLFIIPPLSVQLMWLVGMPSGKLR